MSLESASGKRDMLLKLLAYLLYWRQTGNPFRMLMTCRSRERLEHMRELARKVVGKQAGLGLFWFCEESALDPFQPATFWGPVWQTAAMNDKFRHLVEERIGAPESINSVSAHALARRDNTFFYRRG